MKTTVTFEAYGDGNFRAIADGHPTGWAIIKGGRTTYGITDGIRVTWIGADSGPDPLARAQAALTRMITENHGITYVLTDGKFGS